LLTAVAKPKRVVIITAFVAAFLFGLLLGHWRWQADIMLASTAAVLLWPARRTRFILPVLIALGLTLGIYRGYQSNFTYSRLEALLHQKVTLSGQVADDPVHNDKGHLIFSLTNLKLGSQSVPGTIRVRSHWAKLQRGYNVQAVGRLQPTIGSKEAQFGFAQITVLSTRQSRLEQFRQHFFAGMRTALPEPLASLALGLLVGTRGLIPSELQDQLTRVGLSHIVAVSGYNLTIIVTALYRPLRRHSKFLATALPLWLVLTFTVVSGFSPSIVRAAIVSALMLLSAYYGRKPHAVSVIAVAAALTAAVRPEYLWRDLGWQLSFLAFFGILVLAPAIQQRFTRRTNGFKQLVVESLSAQVLTFPLIMLTFDRLSLASPLANLLVLPLIPAAMLSSFIAAMTGIALPAVAGWLAWPAAIILRMMLASVDYLAAKAWAEVTMTLSVGLTWLWYGLLLLWLMSLHRGVNASKRRQPSLHTQPAV
jgi:competence protein ComEC